MAQEPAPEFPQRIQGPLRRQKGIVGITVKDDKARPDLMVTGAKITAPLCQYASHETQARWTPSFSL